MIMSGVSSHVIFAISSGYNHNMLKDCSNVITQMAKYKMAFIINNIVLHSVKYLKLNR